MQPAHIVCPFSGVVARWIPWDEKHSGEAGIRSCLSLERTKQTSQERRQEAKQPTARAPWTQFCQYRFGSWLSQARLLGAPADEPGPVRLRHVQEEGGGPFLNLRPSLCTELPAQQSPAQEPLSRARIAPQNL